MKLAYKPYNPSRRNGGWALLVVMSLSACALLLLAGVMDWANQNATATARNNEYFATSYAAEAATEKVLAALSQEYQDYSFPGVATAMSTYQTTIPTSADSSYWTGYQFSSGHTANQLIVTNTATAQNIVEGAPFTGLTLTENTYEIIANAEKVNSQYGIVCTVGQQIYLGNIPLFQFAVFYQQDMEIAPGAAMTINGVVHGNAHIYLEPQDGLTLGGDISAVDQVILGESPEDPSVRTISGVTFDGSELNGVAPLNVPVGTNTSGTVSNTSQNVYGILEPPTAGETPTSATGTNLLYNKADMIITISNNNAISVTSGAFVNGQATTIPQSQWQTFLSTNGTFYDQRDSLTVDPTVLNVSNLLIWSATNTILSTNLAALRPGGGNVQSIYVDDQRNTVSNAVTAITNTTSTYPSAGTFYPPVATNKNSHGTVTGYTYISQYVTNVIVVSQPGVVLTNGAVLPPQGLSVATPDPVYVVGNWNVKNSTNSSAPSDAGSSAVQYTLPSAIYADAITVLSSAWNPANSKLALSSRAATSDTVNAAFLTGNVPSNGTDYSGGVENFPRFLEDWGSQTFTYNGSMVCMFASQIANAPWPGTGTVYNPPTRNWAFDTNFYNPSQQPPLMPQIITVQRGKWTSLAPYTTRF
jgi:hypothetical protein